MNQTCKQCGQGFEITKGDRKFYEDVSPIFNTKKELLPLPTLCPDCRFQRRLSFRNLRHLSHRKCDRTGKAIVSCYRDSSPHTVYHTSEWWSDNWDPLQYGRDFDFSRPFFDQFFEVYRAVPTVHQYATNDIQNCEYVNGVGNCKNCYLSFMMDYCEDAYYVSFAEHCRSCVDCLGLTNCELCYECVDCRDCYHLLFAERCVNCSDSAFLSDCLRCKNCIGCNNLVDKEYYVFNKECTPAEFQKQKVALLQGANLSETLRRFRAWSLTTPKKYYFGNSNENFSGDHVTHVKNSTHCFDAFELEDCKYCNYVFKAHHCMDYHVFGDQSSWIYQCVATGQNCSNDLFCLCCWSGSSNNLYCHLISACQHCFGCSGLKSKKYCIFNKQYTKEEYEKLVPKIIEHMRKTPYQSSDNSGTGQAGEWGEYFPMSMSAFGYNESEAFDYFPLTREEVVAKGWQWQEDDDVKERYMGPVIEVPQSIDDVGDEICSQILLCEVTGKPYKIIPQELKFYRDIGIAPPRKCPDQRHEERWKSRNPRKIWDRACAKCQKSIATSYAPDRPEKIYCEECYLQEVY